AEVTVRSPADVIVAGTVILGRGSRTRVADGVHVNPADVRLFVAGRRVRMARDTTVTGRLCAPAAAVALLGTTVDGTVVGGRIRVDHATVAAPYLETRDPCTQHSTQRSLYFGDLHVHTTLSFDAHAFDVQTTPADAYRFAKGDPVALPPLDMD